MTNLEERIEGKYVLSGVINESIAKKQKGTQADKVKK